MKSIHKNFVAIRNFTPALLDIRHISEINKKINKEVSCYVRWDLIDRLVNEAFIDRIFALPIDILIKFKYFKETKY